MIVTGMGKSGIICRKIAATLSSTGTPAFFLHPAEAVHGDLGVDPRRRRRHRAVLQRRDRGAASASSRRIKRLGRALIAMTGAPRSTLAQAADVALDCRVSEEACPMNLVPTASTTAMLALGDALAMTVLVEKGFQPDDFAHLHPGGKLGKRLMRVEQLMHGGDRRAAGVSSTTAMRDVIYEMSRKGLGMTCVVDDDGALARHHHRRRPAAQDGGDRQRPRAHGARRDDAATRSRSRGTTLAAEALNILEQRKITSIVVVDDDRRVEGVVHLHDLWRTELV